MSERIGDHYFVSLFRSLSAINREEIARERGDIASADIARKEAKYWDGHLKESVRRLLAENKSVDES